MGGRGTSSQSSRSGNTYGIHVRRNQSLKEITEGAHKAYSDMDKHNLRINLNKTYKSLANVGRKLKRAQGNKRALERELSAAKKVGDAKTVKTLTDALKSNEISLQTQMINVKNLKTVRDIARGYYAKYK